MAADLDTAGPVRWGPILCTIVLYGCTVAPDSPPAEVGRPSRQGPSARLARAPTPPDRGGTPPPRDTASPPAPQGSTAADRPLAVVDGHWLTWGDLRPRLVEAAGGETLQGLVLDRLLERAVAEAGIVITTETEQAEETLLLETLDDDPDTARRLLAELRDAQRLGPIRFRSLLRRNAMLRALVRDRVNVTESSVARLHDALHGPRRQVRLVTVPDLATASRVEERLRSGAFFGDVAVERSTDRSAARGGLLEPVSRLDPSYPDSLREAIWALEHIGDRSDPILLDRGYALIELVREIDADGVEPSEVRSELTRIARLQQERLLMDELALRLLANAEVTIFDDGLAGGWQQFRRGRQP